MEYKAKPQYIAIDLKSFYASVECVERGLDPLDACLVVADKERTSKTICLAVSSALKTFGTGGRPRLFEVEQRIKEVNRHRGRRSRSFSGRELAEHPDVQVDYIVARPRMALYMDYSRRIYEIYCRFIAPEDIHVYSVDEVFIDVAPYLYMYKMTAHELCINIVREVLKETGITATAGIGSNLYLCKVAMDILAKKMVPDRDGVRIAELDEISYRQLLWDHEPITDFWRVGSGTAKKLALYGITTMGQLARFSLNQEYVLYKLFGVNAELLIDHAWGWEPVTMPHIKSYQPETHSLSSGQVLHEPYSADNARTIIMEMADSLSLDLVEKGLVTAHLTVTIGYDTSSLDDAAVRNSYTGKIHLDHYGRRVPAHAHSTLRLDTPTSSTDILIKAVRELYDRIINPQLLVRRLNVSFNNLVNEACAPSLVRPVQLDLFTDYDQLREIEEKKKEARARERRRQDVIIGLKKRFGKNAILKGLNFRDGATQRQRNHQIGGHNA